MTSKEYEMELENENETNFKRITELEEENDKLTRDFEKIQLKYNSEVRQVEKENDTMKK